MEIDIAENSTSTVVEFTDGFSLTGFVWPSYYQAGHIYYLQRMNRQSHQLVLYGVDTHAKTYKKWTLGDEITAMDVDQSTGIIYYADVVFEGSNAGGHLKSFNPKTGKTTQYVQITQSPFCAYLSSRLFHFLKSTLTAKVRCHVLELSLEICLISSFHQCELILTLCSRGCSGVRCEDADVLRWHG